MWLVRKKIILFMWTICVLNCTGCLEFPVQNFQANRGGVVFMYISCQPKLNLDVSFEISALSFMNSRGEWIKISLNKVVDSKQLRNKQFKLAEISLPPGRYHKLKLEVKRAKKTRKNKTYSLALANPSGEYELSFDLDILPQSSNVFFLDWYPEASVVHKYLFKPKFNICNSSNGLKNLLLYVTCSASNSVLVINRQEDKVVDVIGVGNAPKGIVANPDGRKVYVANFDSKDISVLDPTLNKVITTISNFDYSPLDLALSKDGRWLYATNPEANCISVIDLGANVFCQSIHVGNDPGAIAYDPLRQKLYVLNRGDNSISVVDASSFQLETTIMVGLKPMDLNIFEDKLYITSPDTNNIFVVDLTSYTVEKIIYGLAQPTGIIGGLFGNMYLSLEATNEVAFWDPGMGITLRNISVGSSPEKLALDSSRRKLYVLNRNSEDISVIDLNQETVKTSIQIGKDPYDLVILN
ncbi:MAG: hypothetical protein Q9M37_03565 [Desulfonauticus sp.]|nr:hypothetical protein [Desulfonauticus sp.]